MLVCGLALRWLVLPVPVCSVRRGGLRLRALPVVAMLAALVPLLLGWAACALLTAAGLLAPDNRLVTSEWREDRVHARDVFAVPWPGGCTVCTLCLKNARALNFTIKPYHVPCETSISEKC